MVHLVETLVNGEIHLSCIVDTMVADGLVMPGTKAPEAMVST